MKNKIPKQKKICKYNSINKIKKFKKIKNLILKKKKITGRNNKGRITINHKGGGAKKLYRKIDFVRNKDFIEAKIIRKEYDPNRNCKIILIKYKDGEKKYILNIEKLKINNKIISGKKEEIKIGNTVPINEIPIGTNICCIEIIPNKGGIISRAAGTYSTVIKQENNYCIIKLKSGEIKKINKNCKATIGKIADKKFIFRKLKKAGINRHKNIRPTVRGVAMNPIDHPHGGGEGKTTTKRQSVNKNGNLKKGKKTRKNKRTKCQ